MVHRDDTIRPMTDAEYRLFAALLRGHAGLNFAPDVRILLEKRIARRVKELELKSFSAYHYQLRQGRSGGVHDGRRLGVFV